MTDQDATSARQDATQARTERKMDELHSDVVGVRIALAELTAEVKASNAAQVVRDTAASDHEQRLRALEDRTPHDLPKQLEDGKRFRYMLVGGAVAAGTAGGGIAAVIARALMGAAGGG